MKTKLPQILRAVIAFALFAGAGLFLRHALREYHYHDIVARLREIPPGRRLLALALTAASYLALTGYDLLAFRYIKNALAYRRVALAAFVGHAFSQNIGLAVLTASSIRYRLYTGWGLGAVEVTNVVAFATATFWLGFAAAGGVLFLAAPPLLPAALHLPIADARPVGFVLVALLAGYLAWSLFGRRRPVRVREWEFEAPSPPLALAQVLLGVLDWTLAGAVLFVLLPAGTGFSLAGVLGRLPPRAGGRPREQRAGRARRLRVGGARALARGGAARGRSRVARRVPRDLLLDAARRRGGPPRGVRDPAEEGGDRPRGPCRWPIGGAARPELLRVHHVRERRAPPLLRRRAGRSAACRVALRRPAAACGRALALPREPRRGRAPPPRARAPAASRRGVSAHGRVPRGGRRALAPEGVRLGGGARALDHARDAAPVPAPLLPPRLAPRAALQRGLDLGDRGRAPRHGLPRRLLAQEHGLFPRPLVALRGRGRRVSLSPRERRRGRARRLLRRVAPSASGVRPAHVLPGPDELERAAAIVERSHGTTAALALLGDKALLFSESGNAFIMYGVEGRSWVALGDPIGPEEERAELVWRFRERSDLHGGFTVFYEVLPENLHLYLDLGLTLLKLGEEAKVPLEGFSLEGKSRKSLRHAVNRHEKEGYAFRVAPREAVPALLPELERVSNAWLAGKNTREKRFSVGFFDAAYLARFPAALVEREGKVVAFANLIFGAEKEELSLDLMRYVPDEESGVMEYLFVKLMLFGKAEGFRTFNLGMAPLSGLEGRPLAPLWTRVASLVFQHGEHFYNFQGLRDYKAKFDPVWEPKYLASPGGLLVLPRILTNVAALISGGVRGVVSK